MTTMKSVPSKNVAQAIEFVRSGGRLVVQTMTRITVIDRKTLVRFEKANAWLLKEDGDGYRLRNGKGSVYLFPGQLQYEVAA